MITRLAVSIVSSMLCSSVAFAGIIGTTGDVTVVAPPPSVAPPNFQENDVIHLFPEQNGVALPSDVTADMTVHYTTYDPPPPASGRTLGTIPTGTIVNSYYIHFDPVTGNATQGSVTFAEPILGVIAEGDTGCPLRTPPVTTETDSVDPPGNTLGPSNFLGALGTTYPDGECYLGIENAPDRLTLGENTLSIVFGAGSPGDRVRVLTAQDGTPSLCGNGALDAGETCDDGDLDPGDGCFGCQPEACSTCSGAPSTCTPIATCADADGCCPAGCYQAIDDDCAPSCLESKIKCVSKKKDCRLKCYEKAAKEGMPVSTDCLQDCSGKFAACFLKYENKGGCITIGDSAAIEAKIDAFVDDVKAELDQAPADDVSSCRQQKMKCVDKYDACILKVFGKAADASESAPPSVAVAKCRAKFNGGVKGLARSCFAKAEAKNTCETIGDVFAMQNKDDAFIDDVVCALGVCYLVQ